MYRMSMCLYGVGLFGFGLVYFLKVTAGVWQFPHGGTIKTFYFILFYSIFAGPPAAL